MQCFFIQSKHIQLQPMTLHKIKNVASCKESIWASTFRLASCSDRLSWRNIRRFQCLSSLGEGKGPGDEVEVLQLSFGNACKACYKNKLCFELFSIFKVVFDYTYHIKPMRKYLLSNYNMQCLEMIVFDKQNVLR